MELYQETEKRVNGSIAILDEDVLTSRASAGLLSLSVELGLEVLRQMLEGEATKLAGSKGKHQQGRKAYRHGKGKSKVVMGGQKVPIERPRVRTLEGSELPLPTLNLFQQEDPLNQALLSRLLCGVSTRKYARTIDVPFESAGCISKSEVSRRFGAGLEAQMEAFFTRPIEGSYPVMMLDGLELGKMTIVAAMGIDTEGRKRILGLVEGGSENSEMVKMLLDDLITRGLDALEPRLYVLDGSKALYKGVKDTFGKQAVIQRCQVHKKRNVLSYLPESEKENVSTAMTLAYREFEYDKAKEKLNRLANHLEQRYPSAAASLREGLEETLTVHRLKVPGLLRKTLATTNPMESANSACAGVLRRVSHFRDGKMALRHAAAGFLEAEGGFHRINGYRQLSLLAHSLNLLTNSGDWNILASA